MAPVNPAVSDEEPEELRRAIWPAGYERTRTLSCRHCRQKNRVGVSSAVVKPEAHHCGRCKQSLFLGREEPLHRISPVAYQHGLDRRSSAALKSLPGTDALMRWLVSTMADRFAQMLIMSDAVKCGPDQFPELVTLMDRARSRLDFRTRPALFISESPHMNAMTTGFKDPTIVVWSELLTQMNDREVEAVLGHELGHLQAHHPLHHSVARLLMTGFMNASQTVRFLGMPLWRALLTWTRSSELTADRAALLATRDLEVCISVMLRFAAGNRVGTRSRTKMRLAPFIRQCRELVRIRAELSLDRLLQDYMDLDRSHPHVALRVIHLIRWVEHGNYLNIVSGDYLRLPSTREEELNA